MYFESRLVDSTGFFIYNNTMTHYNTLGIAESATAEEIKKTYRKLASQHHPDKGGETSKFQSIQVAYDVLSDPAKKEQYDLERTGRGQPNIHFQWHGQSGGHPDITEIFKNFGFGTDPFGQFRQQPQQARRNKDLRISLSLPLVATLEEQSRTISVATTNGQRETIEVKIPRGVIHGTNIKYTGLGDNLFNTIPRGDLYVQINVHSAENFISNGIDLYTTCSVNCLLAITGGNTNIIGIDGKTFILTIPPGVQPGTKFRISDQGLYQMNSDVRGNLYIELGVTVPQDLSPDQLQIVKSILNN